MLVFVSFELSIVVDSVCFSWELGPRTSCVSFTLAALCVCKITIVVAEKAEVKC